MSKSGKAARAAYGTYSRNREEAARQTREAILTAAQKLFAAQGYATTGINQIANVTGISRQTFYLHFSSKIEVLDQLIETFEQGVMILYEELAAIVRPDLALLSQWTTRFLAFCEADQKTVLLLLGTVPVEVDLAQDRADRYQRILTLLGQRHKPFSIAASGEDAGMRGRAVSLLAQVESLPRLAITAVPLCDKQSLITALAENLLAFLERD
ncbi:hypothetical protein MB02_11360 [Croceicoccus estronivorus]|nr:hypothetical protein MB02_11360 [Croceicoccus estronivorus]